MLHHTPIQLSQAASTVPDRMPALALKAFRVKRLHVETKDPESPGKSDNIDITFSWATAQEKDDSYIRVLTFGIRTSSVQVKERPVPEVDVLIEGKFQLANNLPEDQLEEILLINGSAILYGTVRGLLAGISGAFSGGQLMLPSVDMVEVVQGMMKDQKLKSPGEPKRSATSKTAGIAKPARPKSSTPKKKTTSQA